MIVSVKALKGFVSDKHREGETGESEGDWGETRSSREIGGVVNVEQVGSSTRRRSVWSTQMDTTVGDAYRYL